MKKYDLVLLNNEKSYKAYALQKNMHGVIIDCDLNKLSVLFFNPKNQGDYIIAKINADDVIKENQKLPDKIIGELDLIIENLKGKEKFTPLVISAYDIVELIVEDDKYSEFGIHKGDRGCVMDDNAVENYIEVDFSGIDNDGNFYGKCISVKTDDLKVVK